MSHIDADRVLEVSTTTGAGDITLAGAVTGYLALAQTNPDIADGDTVDLYIEDVLPATGVPTGAWECGTYTWRTGGTLERTTVRGSSNGGAAVEWGQGIRRVGMGMLAYMVATVRAVPVTMQILEGHRETVELLAEQVVNGAQQVEQDRQAIEGYQAQITVDAATFNFDADKVHAIVHGPASGAGSTVETEGGSVRTFAKIDADLESSGAVATVLQKTADAEAAKVAAEAALAGVASAGTLTDANFLAAAYAGTVISGTPRYASDPFDGSALGVYAEGASRNELYDTEFTTTGGPGGLPTAWNTTNSIGGLTPSVVAKDASGITIRIQGVPSASGGYLLTMCSTSAIAAAAGEVWSASMDMQRLPGAAGVNANGLFIIERTAGGVFVNQTIGVKTLQEDVTFPESMQRTVVAGPRITAGMYFSATSGVAVDVTYKIKNPQLEKQAHPTSYIATPAGGGASRADDALVAAAPDLFSTHFIAGEPSRFIGTGTLMQMDDGTNSNRVTFYIDSFDLYCRIVQGGMEVSTTYLGRVLPMTRARIGVALTPMLVAASYNGKDAVTIPVPDGLVGMTRVQLGAGANGAWGGTIARYTGISAVLPVSDLRRNTVPAGLFDDFDRAAGALGTPPTGQTYSQYSNGGPLATIDADGFVVSQNRTGGASTATYNAYDNGMTPERFAAAISFSAGTQGQGNATLIANANGMTSVGQIIASSLHIGFLDTAVQIQAWVGGSFVVYGDFPLTPYCERDGVTVYNIAWRVVGNAIIALMPDRRLCRVVSAQAVAQMGRYGVYESYWAGADAAASAAAPRSKFKAVAAH